MTVEQRSKRRAVVGGYIPLLAAVSGLAVGLTCASFAAESPVQQDSLRPWLQRSNAVYSLHEAAAVGDLAVAKARLAEGADTEMKDELGRTPLYIAAQNDRQEFVALLLECGADLSSCDASGKGVLSFYEGKPMPPAVQKAYLLLDCCREAVEAIGKGDVAGLEKCLAQGLSPNARHESRYLLQYALDKGDAALAETLLQAGATPNVRYADGKTALHIAAGRGNADAAKALVAHGADPFSEARNGATPLHEAVWYARMEVLDYLLPLYKGDNFTPGNRNFPVCMAIDRRLTKALKLFIDHGLDVNDKRFSREPLLISAVRTKNEEAVRLLLKAGADRNARDKDGCCAADYADDSLKALLK